MCHHQTQKLLVEKYVPPESGIETSAPKQRARRAPFPPGLRAEQAFAAASFVFKRKALHTSLFQGGTVSTSPTLVHMEEIVNLQGELLQLSDHYANLQIKCLGSGFQAESGTSGM